ncbi:probable E3 ubiquitin-protein ligase RHA2B [Solanum tuberosum]|uniref:RING-type domain-containing protein n=1 Tax=Solanum tuberosum TaxID=4113 RepID=M1AYX3_SOLTU|nr:PREDICTED: probable E3 ubiquitin-protein ligase RHA2B [Solanum tuberosum]
MAALSQLLAHIYTMTLVFFTILILELVIFVRSITETISDSGRGRPITTKQYIKLIDEKNPVSRFKTASINPDGFSDTCAVCLSAFEDGEQVRKLKCKHIFHKDCLDTWLQQDSATCPLCRNKVLPEEIVVKFRQHRNHHTEYEGSDEELIFLLSALHGNYIRRFL